MIVSFRARFDEEYQFFSLLSLTFYVADRHENMILTKTVTHPFPNLETTQIANIDTTSNFESTETTFVQKSMKLTHLLSSLADSCARGCEVIRSVEKRMSDPTKSSDLTVQYKVEGDARSALTEADVSSQLVIITCIRSVWGDSINIIGEEDSSDTNKLDVRETFQKYNVDLPTLRPVQNNFFGDDVDVDMNDITLYIDPMDGTREFVEGRYRNVQCLIGVCHKNLPICGVIGLPFVNQNGVNVICALNTKNTNIIETLTFCGGKGTMDEPHSFQALEEPGSSDAHTLKLFTGDSNRMTKKISIDYLSGFMEADHQGHILNMCVTGGCGNKILRLIACGSLGYNALAIMPPGTCSWDTAAPTALLLAACNKFGIDVKVTDMLGSELVYDSSGLNVTNNLGCFVSVGKMAVGYHELVCENMKNDSIVLKSLLKK
jgi:3'-phosphoadenosine 5'-phosphosulfate (PAPS) 3'-phosphatase